jgi:hypothetical protein
MGLLKINDLLEASRLKITYHQFKKINDMSLIARIEAYYSSKGANHRPVGLPIFAGDGLKFKRSHPTTPVPVSLMMISL